MARLETQIEGRIGIRQHAHICTRSLTPSNDERRVAHGDIPRVARLILFAPDIDAGDAARGQPAGDRRQYRAPAAPHVEHHFVAAQMQVV